MSQILRSTTQQQQVTRERGSDSNHSSNAGHTPLARATMPTATMAQQELNELTEQLRQAILSCEEQESKNKELTETEKKIQEVRSELDVVKAKKSLHKDLAQLRKKFADCVSRNDKIQGIAVLREVWYRYELLSPDNPLRLPPLYHSSSVNSLFERLAGWCFILECKGSEGKETSGNTLLVGVKGVGKSTVMIGIARVSHCSLGSLFSISLASITPCSVMFMMFLTLLCQVAAAVCSNVFPVYHDLTSRIATPRTLILDATPKTWWSDTSVDKLDLAALLNHMR